MSTEESARYGNKTQGGAGPTFQTPSRRCGTVNSSHVTRQHIFPSTSNLGVEPTAAPYTSYITKRSAVVLKNILQG